MAEGQDLGILSAITYRKQSQHCQRVGHAEVGSRNSMTRHPRPTAIGDATNPLAVEPAVTRTDVIVGTRRSRVSSQVVRWDPGWICGVPELEFEPVMRVIGDKQAAELLEDPPFFRESRCGR